MMKNMRQAAPEMTEQQKKEASLRAAIQKRNSLIEGTVFNLVRNTGNTLPAEEAVDYAIAVADDLMKKVYGLVAEEE